MDLYKSEREEIQKTLTPINVVVGGCRCRECKGTDRYDKYGPFHFYWNDRYLGYLMRGVLFSYYGRATRLDNFNRQIPQLLGEAINKIK